MIYFLNDHKIGFVLSSELGRHINEFKEGEKDPIKINIRTFFRFWNDNNPEDKYVLFIRHPYEIITSGYHFHKICSEIWAIGVGIKFFEWWDKNHFTKEFFMFV